jgi:hypothetical protein
MKSTNVQCQFLARYPQSKLDPTNLGEPVERHPSDEEVREELGDREYGEHDPVHQPLDVVVLVLRLDGLHRAARNFENC